MRVRFGAAVVAVSLLAGAQAGVAGEGYSGAGFTGMAWIGSNGTADQQLGTMNVGKKGVRIDMVQQGQKMSMLTLWGQAMAYSLMHDQKMYMEVPVEQAGMTSADKTGKPCGDHKTAEELGAESVNGRDTVKYRCIGQIDVPKGKKPSDATEWYDSEIGMPIKTVTDAGDVFEVRDIAVGQPGAGLFTVPAAYKKFDMNAMMQQMQQNPQ